MPPKKKAAASSGGTGKKKTRSKTGSAREGRLLDGVAISEMTREQLEGHVDRLRRELNREREERGFFQVYIIHLRDDLWWIIVCSYIEFS